MSESIRVLHCVVNMNRGGAETLIMNLYRNIDVSKVQFDFLTSNEGVFDKEIKKLGGKVYRIPYITEVGLLEYAKLLRSFFINHNEYKIVHCHMDKMSGIVLREAKRTGVPVRIAHSHSTKSEGNAVNKLVKAHYSKYVIKCSTHKFACSEAAAKFLFRKTDGVTILRNGIQVEEYRYDENNRREVRTELGINDKFVIGHIGRFSEPKNHRFLIKIFKEVYKKNKDAVLCMIGNGILEDEIRRIAVHSGIENNVIFLGSRADVWRILNAFDVFCFPSLYEGFGIAVLEAQTSGLKCIVSDVITREVDVTGNVRFVSLKKPAMVWAEEILENAHYNRKDMTKIVKLAGYDIADSAGRLQKYYENIRKLFIDGE